MFALDHDAWAAVGHYLDPVSLFNLACSCQDLQKDISSNSSLWRVQAEHRWPALFSGSNADNIHDWHAAYKAAHKASIQLATQQPWTASIPKPSSNATPTTAQVLMHSSMQAAPSTASCRIANAGLAWQHLTCVAAAFEEQIHFWKWTAQADLDPPFVGQVTQHGPCHSSGSLTPCPEKSDSTAVEPPEEEALGLPSLGLPGFAARRVEAKAARAVGAAAQHYCSAAPYSHTAAVSVLVQVPTGGPLPGFASGSRDSTIKLWTPFSATASSSSSANARGSSDSCKVSIRPMRTLKSHTDHITALMCLSASHSSFLASIDSNDSTCGSAILVSGSADRTIKLWSLSSIQQQPAAAHSFSTDDADSSSGSSLRRGGQHKQQQQQQSRQPLLGTLRGHTGAVTSLLACSDISPVQSCGDAPANDSSGSAAGSSSSSSSGSSGSFLSGGKDCQVKLWDVSEGRRSCVGTWRLQQQCRQLLGGLDMPGCVVMMLENRMQVCDTRVSPGRAPGIVALPHFPRGVTAAAVSGYNVAAGSRAGRREGNVRVWDVRMILAGSATAASAASTSGSGAVSRPLLSGFLPQGTVSRLHLDSVKLVAACDGARFNSASGIGVWNLATGERIDIPSSCLSGIDLHPHCLPYEAAEDALGCGAWFDRPRITMHALINQLSETQMIEALNTINDDLADYTSETGSSEWDWASSDDVTSLGDESSADVMSHSDEPPVPHAAAAVDHPPSWTHSEEEGLRPQHPSQYSEDGSAAAQLAREADADADDAAGSSKRSGQGCVEPGVLALAVQGPMVACVDSMGNFLLRDFTAGVPGPSLLRKFAGSGAAAAAAASGSGSLAGGSEGVSAAEVAQQLSHLKFWQK